MKQYIILNTSRKHVNYEEDKNNVPMNKPYKRDSGRNDLVPHVVISLRLGFRRNFLSVLHPNLVSSPIQDILEIFNLTPPRGEFRWISWHGRIVSDQVQVRFHKSTYFPVRICKNIDIYLPFTAYIQQNNPKSTLS